MHITSPVTLHAWFICGESLKRQLTFNGPLLLHPGNNSGLARTILHLQFHTVNPWASILSTYQTVPFMCTDTSSIMLTANLKRIWNEGYLRNVEKTLTRVAILPLNVSQRLCVCTLHRFFLDFKCTKVENLKMWIIFFYLLKKWVFRASRPHDEWGQHFSFYQI